MACNFLNHGNALIYGKESLLGVVDHDSDNDLIEKSGSTRDDVDMTESNGVKGTWADHSFHRKTLADPCFS